MSAVAKRAVAAFVLWDLRAYIHPHKGALALAAISMGARAFVLLLMPWPLKFIIDSVLFHESLPRPLAPWLPDPTTHALTLLDALGAIMLVLGIAETVLGYFGNRILVRTGQSAVLALRQDLFAHLQRLSLAFHRRQKSGDLMARLGGDIQTLQEFVVAVGTGLLAHLLTVVGMAAVMFAVDWRFALLVLSVAPLLLFMTRRHAIRLKGALRQARKSEGELWGAVQETIANVHAVQAYGREAHEDARFSTHARRSFHNTLEASILQLRFTPTVSLVMAVATGATAWYGATQVLAHRITAGDLLVFLAYLRATASPVRQFAKMASVVGKASVAAERLGDLFQAESEVTDPPTARAPHTCQGRIQFLDVRFGYEPDRPVLQDISFAAGPGQTIALVGATGAGKSTLVSLVSRFHDPASGCVRLDDIDLRELPLGFVRGQVAWVLQDVLVFSGPLWENIAYGRAGAGRDEAIRAAETLGIDAIIQKLPQGYDTIVGERGASLSGGQRQCVAIARALLRDAPIVILDEPTSGLDALTERVIMRALARLTAGRTTLVIAHRLRTIRAADRILVLHNGHIIESGTHDELLLLRGRYHDMWGCTAEDTSNTASHYSALDATPSPRPLRAT